VAAVGRGGQADAGAEVFEAGDVETLHAGPEAAMGYELGIHVALQQVAGGDDGDGVGGAHRLSLRTADGRDAGAAAEYQTGEWRIVASALPAGLYFLQAVAPNSDRTTLPVMLR